jgi:predicted PurR-regulated permease PerM
MILVMWGLLFGFVGLIWAIVVDVVFEDHPKNKIDSRVPREPAPESHRPESRAA